MMSRMKFTAARRLLFLDCLRRTGSVTHSASVVGMTRAGVYLCRKRDPQFRAEWDAIVKKDWPRTFTPAKQWRFLDTLRATCNVTLAARAVGMARSTLYRLRDQDLDFRAAWDDAVEEAIDLLEAELHRRAFTGVDRPVFWRGEIQRDAAGRPVTVKDYSDGLAMFLMRAHRPERYRERIEARLSNGLPVRTAIRLRGRAGEDGGPGGDQSEDHDPGN